MSTDTDDLILDRLSDDFRRRLRDGEGPKIDEYAANHPHLAERIRETFPGVVALEQSLASSIRVRTSAGVRLGDYLLLREIGSGGMGVVFEAEQASLERRVAIKILSPSFAADPRAKARFQREARVAAKLHHTNIVPIFDVGEVDGVCYYSMQFLDGATVDRLITVSRRRSKLGIATRQLPVDSSSPPLDPTQTAEDPIRADATDPNVTDGLEIEQSAFWAEQAAEALEYAHRHGIVHRDVKPSNLIVDDSGILWVADFGIARFEDDGLTRTGEVVGTLRFMAPERLRGECSSRVDTFALGATLYEMLSGRAAFPAVDRVELLKQIEACEPVPLRAVAPHVPRDLETIVNKAMEKEPERRFASAGDMAEDLRRFLAGETLLSRRPNPLERMVRFCKRRPASAAVIGLSILMLLGTAVASVLFAKETQRAVAAERDSKIHEADAYLAQANGISLSGRQGQRFEALAALKKAVKIAREYDLPPEWFARARNEAIAAVALPDVGPDWPCPIDPSTGVRCAASPNHRMYVRLTPTGKADVMERDTNTVVAPISGEAPFDYADFVSDECVFLQTAGPLPKREFWRMNEARTSMERAIVIPDRFFMLDVRRDGSAAAVSDGQGNIDVVSLPKCERIATLPARRARREVAAAIHPTKPWIASTSYFSDFVVVRDYSTGRIIAEMPSLDALPKPSALTGGIAWTADGNELCVSTERALLKYDFAGNGDAKGKPKVAPFSQPGNAAAFNPRGDRFVARGWHDLAEIVDQSGKRIGAFPVGGTPHHRWNDPELITLVGTRNSGDSLVYRVADGREVRQVFFPEDSQSELNGTAVSFSPDGRLLACIAGGKIWVFDVHQERIVANGVGGAFSSVGFAPDGAILSRGASGSWRWPRRVDPRNPTTISFGPPDPLRFRGAHLGNEVIVDPDCLAEVCYPGYGEAHAACLWYAGKGRHRLQPFEKPSSVGNVAFRPDDGSLVASVDGVFTVIDTRTGLSRKLSDQPAPQLLKFLEDGRLVFSGRDGILLDREFRTIRHLGEGALYDANTRLGVALFGLRDGTMRLAAIDSGVELARIRLPRRAVEFARLSPDGRFIVARTPESLRFFDLEAIGERLRELGLVWDVPRTSDGRAPLEGVSVEFVGMERLLPSGRANARLCRDISDVVKDPFNPECWRILGTTLGNTGRSRAARFAYAASLRLAPNDLEIQRESALIEAMFGDGSAGYAALRALASAHPRDVDVVLSAVAVALHRSAWCDAIDIARNSPTAFSIERSELRLLPELAAYAFDRLGEKASADEWRRRNEAQHLSLAQNTEIFAFGRLFDEDLRLPAIYSLVLAEAGLRRDPNRGNLHWHQALALARLGRFVEADQLLATLPKPLEDTDGFWFGPAIRMLVAIGLGRATDADLTQLKAHRERVLSERMLGYPKKVDVMQDLEVEAELAFLTRRR